MVEPQPGPANGTRAHPSGCALSASWRSYAGRVGRRIAVAAVVVTLAISLGGCGDDDDPVIGAPDTTSTSGSSGATVSTRADEAGGGDGIDPMEDASTSPVSVAPTATDGHALLGAVRSSRHEGYDRVVFEFTNALPGYQVQYVDEPVHEDGSGEEVDVAGDHVLLVRMENASGADLSKEDAPQTYTGPTRFDPGTPEVAELVRVGDFEGVLTWAIGVRDEVAFRVTTLDGPPRLVVDVQNH